MNAAELEAAATVDVNASPERVFRAMTTGEVTKWWVRPGIFDTREWVADVRPGGKWHTSGLARGKTYAIDGEFLEVDAPHKLTFTWQLGGMPLVTTVSFELRPIEGGTRVSVHHRPFPSEEACEPNRIGWETSLDALRKHLEHE